MWHLFEGDIYLRAAFIRGWRLSLQPAWLKSQSELRFESTVPVAIFNFTNTLPVGTKHIYPSTIKNICGRFEI